MKTLIKPKKPRLKRGEQKEIRTQELLDATWELFCEVGYDAVTIDKVAELAGYSRKPIYTLFGDKQSLFFEMWSRKFAELVELTLSLLDPKLTLRANLRRLAEVAADRGNQGENQRGESLLFVMQTITLGRQDLAARARKLFEESVKGFAQAIKRCPLERGQRLRSNPELVAAHLMAHIGGLSRLEYQTGRNYMHAQDLYELFVYMAIVSGPEAIVR
ncbi:MAG TPA: TetR/AcrR family transcriptional regulator [Solimonas sp.]|nr:TetR/AcrR family transcriptional regulator [Solimonas sp.]